MRLFLRSEESQFTEKYIDSEGEVLVVIYRPLLTLGSSTVMYLLSTAR